MKKIILSLIMFLAPVAASAQAIDCSITNGRGISDLITNCAGNGINVIMALIFAAALLVFIYNIFKYFFTNSEKSAKDAAKLVTYGVIGFAVMVSVFGLVRFVTNTFGLSGVGPQIQFNRN